MYGRQLLAVLDCQQRTWSKTNIIILMFNSDWPSDFKTTLYCMYPGFDVSPSWF